MPAEHRRSVCSALGEIPAIRPGDDLARILGDALEAAGLWPRAQRRARGDPQGRVQGGGAVRVARGVKPSPRARELAAATGKDAALVEVILSESRAVLRFRPGLIIAEHRLGMVLANAGVDQSNVPHQNEPRVLLLPKIPTRAAAALRAALEGALRQRACRGGQRQRRARMAQGRGRAGDRRRGTAGAARPARPADLDGRALQVTQVGLADEIASAAQLLMGEADEGRPVVLVRGLAWQGPRAGRGAAPRARGGLFR